MLKKGWSGIVDLLVSVLLLNRFDLEFRDKE